MSDLSDDQLMQWREWQRRDPSIHGPFFSPEYVRVMSRATPSVRVVVLERDGSRCGYLPVQMSNRVAHSVGLRAGDFSGIVCPPGLEWHPLEIVRQCGLDGWDFSGVDPASGPLRPYVRVVSASPFIDLGQGFDAYWRERRAAGSDLLVRIGQKGRKLAREVGPLRIELYSRDTDALARLFEWKAEQRRATRTVDVLTEAWMRKAIHAMAEYSSPTFAGVLCTLTAGDTLAAVHFGMRSERVLHYWFAAYNRSLGPYSPGLLLLIEMARAASAAGLTTITLGPGDELYKLSFASGATPVARGSVDVSLSRRLVNDVWYGARALSRRSPAIHAVVQSVKRLHYRWVSPGEDAGMRRGSP